MVTVLYSPVLMKLDPSVSFNNEVVKFAALDCDKLDALEEDLKKNLLNQASEKLLIIYPTIESVFFHASNDTIDPVATLEKWRNLVNVALRLVKRHRATSYLVSDLTLSQKSNQLQTLLDENLFATSSTQFSSIVIPPIFKLIANSFLEKDPSLKRLTQQALALECVEAVFDEPSLAELSVSVCDEWRRSQQANEALKNELAELEASLSCVQKESAELQKKFELERVELNKKNTSAINTLKDAHEKQLTDLNTTHQSALNDLTEENQLLLEQLHLVQETLEAHLIEAKAKAEELNNVTQELAETQSELDRTQLDLKKADADLASLTKTKKELEASLSFVQKESAELQKKFELERVELNKKNTSAINTLKDAHEKQLTDLNTTHQSALNDLTEENQLLLEQLHLVQETLETQFIKAEDLKKQLLDKEIDSKRLAETAKRYQLNLKQLQVAQSIKSPFEKFKARRKALKLAKVIESSPFFNAEWYLKKYPDVAEHPTFKSRPALHYLQIGGFEGRNPSTGFDSDRYLAVNKDVEEQQMNPLLHYILHGEAEGRDPRP